MPKTIEEINEGIKINSKIIDTLSSKEGELSQSDKDLLLRSQSLKAFFEGLKEEYEVRQRQSA